MSARQQSAETYATRAIDANDFAAYQIGIIHEWLRIIVALTFVLVPMFFVLDVFITPSHLLPRFAVYRSISTLLAFTQYLIIRNTRPGRFSFLHGYFTSLQVGGIIALMTVELGGFDSGYYAGLIMVIIGVNLLMPWRATHTAANTGIILVMYVSFNLICANSFNPAILANNLFFLCGTAIISVAINHVRYRLIQSEFSLLVQLKQARDALWSEMELAKEIQMALLPRRLDLPGYQIDVLMVPAKEVGGDYYEVVETRVGDRYVAIGDVAGHGLNAGLIMMMAQTSAMTVIKGQKDCAPVQVLTTVNSVLRENVGRLDSNHYMTMTVLKLEDTFFTGAGHHQDILVYRAAVDEVEVVSIKGTWLGITDDLEPFLDTVRVPMAPNDVIMLYTDGLTEGYTSDGELYGQRRLEQVFKRHARTFGPSTARRIMDEVNVSLGEQEDDMTLMLVKKTASHEEAPSKKRGR